MQISPIKKEARKGLFVLDNQLCLNPEGLIAICPFPV